MFNWSVTHNRPLGSRHTPRSGPKKRPTKNRTDETKNLIVYLTRLNVCCVDREVATAPATHTNPQYKICRFIRYLIDSILSKYIWWAVVLSAGPIIIINAYATTTTTNSRIKHEKDDWTDMVSLVDSPPPRDSIRFERGSRTTGPRWVRTKTSRGWNNSTHCIMKRRALFMADRKWFI